MADDTRKSSRSHKRAASGATRATRTTGARHPGATGHGRDLDEQQRAGSGPGAGAADDTPPAAAGLGGATGDGDGLTAAALTAAALDDDALEVAAEPILVAERITVLTETPLDPSGIEPRATAADPHPGVDPQHRWLMIAERAYLHASERGFAPGGELEDWLRAEREVNARITGSGG
jgi:hypothetical protein